MVPCAAVQLDFRAVPETLTECLQSEKCTCAEIQRCRISFFGGMVTGILCLQCFTEKQNSSDFYLNTVCHFDFVTSVSTGQELNM